MSQIKTARTQGTPPHIPVIEPLSINQNGTYTAPTGVDGYSPITVDVQEEPWAPLEDGYSNFWFELTDDTLSPWLNFSAKTADAVIDWGDGSGEVALDTLTPTHTYAKAGKYIVKVKGVTGIGIQHSVPYQSEYLSILKYIELNNDVIVIIGYGLQYCVGLKDVAFSDAVVVGAATFRYCASLKKAIMSSATNGTSAYAYCYALNAINFPASITVIPSSCFAYCASLTSVTIPAAISEIAGPAFSYCASLGVVHVQATQPPTLGNNAFFSLPSDFIIYVPTGTGDTYKAAAGWSTYADHIVEEGQTLSKAALRRIQAEKTTDESEGDDVR